MFPGKWHLCLEMYNKATSIPHDYLVIANKTLMTLSNSIHICFKTMKKARRHNLNIITMVQTLKHAPFII